MRRTLPALAAVLIVASLLAGDVGAQVGGYRENDYGDGMVWNVLPPGENGLETTADVLSGATPPHSDDQRPLYEDLVWAVPGLSDADLATYFKDASFGVPEGKVEREYMPTDGVTVIRDSDYGVPHIYAQDRRSLAFAAGYVSAEDRLFLMDVLRHTGRGRLSEFLGPDPSFIAMDRAQIQVTGYDEAELQQQIDQLPEKFGEVGQIIVDGFSAYADGVNQYIEEAMLDPGKMPALYGVIQKVPEPWLPTDSVATASLIGAVFGAGGGHEHLNGELLQRLQEHFGARLGRRVLADLRQRENPEAPLSAPEGRFPYPPRGAADPDAVALPDLSSGEGGRRAPDPRATLLRGLARMGIRFPGQASNAILIDREHSATGNPIFVAGPQVGYFDPQILMELDMHSPEVDARGAAFPGVSLLVLLGRGQDFAWSATSAGADNVDIRAELLCEPDGSDPTVDSTHYLFGGECVEMYQRTDTWTAAPTPAAPGQPQQVTVEIQRTGHGPVLTRGTVDGQPVAFTIQRATWFAEVDSASAFVKLNTPALVDDARSWQQAMNDVTFTFNWFYADDRDIAYFMSCLCPRRAEGVDPDFPSWGTGEWEWQGFLEFEDHPQAINPSQGWMTSWNNKQAEGFQASDGNFAYGSVHRADLLNDRVARAIRGGGELSMSDVVGVMEDAGTVDLRGQEVLPWILRVLGDGGSNRIQRAARILGRWEGDGAHRIDRDKDGMLDDGPAVAIMDAWWPRLVRAIYDRELKGLYGLIPMSFDDRPGPVGSAYIDGYYGYVERDLRHTLGREMPRDPATRYCGRLSRCRDELIAALQKALDALESEYGTANMSEWTVDTTRDQIVFTALRVSGAPPMHWVNRPTWQQVMSFPRHRPR